MTDLVLIRHAPTDWNAEKRIQGRTDTPLSQAGRAELRTWRVADDIQAFDWACSPLRRARDTAEHLGAQPMSVDALIEMDWGQWEGRRLPDLRQALGRDMAANEARGLDFRPPGGESPRDIQHRVQSWLRGLRRPTAAVTHKGVIRAVFALAAGWDMTGKPPQKLLNAALHRFRLSPDGQPEVVELNIPLSQEKRQSA